MANFCIHCGDRSHFEAAFCPTTGKTLSPRVAPSSHPSTTQARGARPVAHVIREYGIAEVVFLSIITFGIFGFVRFYQASKSYDRVQTGLTPNFEWQFWAYLALSLVGLPTLGIGLGVALEVAAVVIGSLMLAEVLRARNELAAGTGLSRDLSSVGLHVTLFAVGSVLAYVVVGFIPLIIQAVLFFSEHNELAARATASPREQAA